MSLPPDQPLYLEGATEPVFATLQRPASDDARDTAVILCPPFGWDEICSYRSRREWAQRLAAAGYPCLRLSYPGSGDSGGDPRDPARLDAWTDAVARAAEWVKQATGATHTVAIGIELGGLVSYRAASAGAPIDDLVLWAAPARAGALLRQLRAFSALELSQFFEGLGPPPPPAGEIQAGGFVLSAETVTALGALNLVELPLPSAALRRVLLLDRDGIGVDAGLAERMRTLGAAVTIAPGTGYAAMTSHPQQARPPFEVIERVTAWLGEASAPTSAAAPENLSLAPGARKSATFTVDGGRIQETPLAIEQPFGTLPGVLAEPLGSRVPGLCVMFLNAGAVRRIGPNRMWVEAARRWAARGVPSFRFDLEGLGDADGDPNPYAADAGLYVPKLVTQVLSTVDFLDQQGIGKRFVLGGLCSGAYCSFQAALEDSRVVAALMLNPRALLWDPSLEPARDFRALRSQPLSWSKIRRLASAARVRALIRWILAAPKRTLVRSKKMAAGSETVDDLLDRLRASGKRALFVFSEHEPLRDELVSSGAMSRIEHWANVTIEYVPVRDHTLRPNQAQRQACQALDRAIELELASNGAEPAS